jgi:galactokinase
MNAEIVRKAFLQQFSAPPECTVRAPGRINLIGEHTDYNGGFVLPAAIEQSIWLAAGRRTDGRFAFWAQDLDAFFITENEQVLFQEQHAWVNYLLGVVSEARQEGLVFGGFNLAFGGNVPLGAGLSSSAALETGALFALNTLYCLGLTKMDIVRLAQRAENNFVGMKCGIMDMFASVMGRANAVVRLDCSDLSYQYFPFESLDFSLVLFDSGVKHALVDSAYNTRRMECASGVSVLKKYLPTIASLRDVTLERLEQHKTELPDAVYKRCKYVVSEMKRVEIAGSALQNNEFETLGRLMYQTHDGLDALYEVSIPEINFLVETARQHHATGSRMMGGGFGGCTLNLVKTAEMPVFEAAVSTAYKITWGIDLKIYPVRLADGTHLVEH